MQPYREVPRRSDNLYVVVMTEDTAVTVEGGEVPVVLAKPAKAGPAVVVVPSIFGIGSDLRAELEGFAEHGAFAASFDPFWRVDPGVIPYSDMARGMERVQKMDRARAYQDFLSVIDWLRAEPEVNGHVIGVGICFGGPFCFLAAADGKLNAVATWHGSRLDGFLDRAQDMKCPMRIHFGDQDPVAPPEVREKVAGAFAGRSDVLITLHPGATHGFSQRDSPAHQPEAHQAAVRSVLELIDAAR